MVKIFKSICIVFLLGSMISSAHADDAENAKKYVDNVMSQAMTILNSNGPDDQKSKPLQTMISRYVDINWIGKFVLGQNWRKATPEQQAAYLKNYENFILKSYASRFIKNKGVAYKMLSARAEDGDKYTVKLTIDTGKEPVMVDYKLRKVGKDFKIFDLNVEGVSLITTQRSEFNSIVQSKGLDYLIEQLGTKSTNLASQ